MKPALGTHCEADTLVFYGDSNNLELYEFSTDSLIVADPGLTLPYDGLLLSINDKFLYDCKVGHVPASDPNAVLNFEVIVSLKSRVTKYPGTCPKVTCNADGTLTTPTINDSCILPVDCPEAFQPSADKGTVDSTGPASSGDVAT